MMLGYHRLNRLKALFIITLRKRRSRHLNIPGVIS